MRFHHLFLASILVLLVVQVSASSASSFINKTLFFDNATNSLYFEDSNAQRNQTVFPVHPPPAKKPLCQIFVNYSRNVTGWNILTLTPDANLLFNENPYKAYYYAGYSEGYWTWEDILNMQYNSNPYPLDPKTQKWFEAHVEFLKNLENNKELIQENPTLVYGAIRFYNFIQGLTDGLNKMIDEKNNNNETKIENWNFIEMLVQSALGGLPDIQAAASSMYEEQSTDSSLLSNAFFVSHNFDDYEKLFVQSYQTKKQTAYFQKHLGTHCSALCKLLDNDIYFSHSTWIDNSFMSKILKTYNFETTVTLSSFPASISSLDDFYYTPKFAVLETSLVQMNTTLTKLYVKPDGGLLECFRVMIANIWAKDAEDWSKLFLTESSSKPGTFVAQIMDYSNQYFCFQHTKPFMNATALSNKLQVPVGTFFLIEQLGPYSEYADWSQKLSTDGYIPGFNFAFFPRIKQLTGLTHLEEKYGAMFSDKLYARAQIFARNQSDVKNIQDMQNLMRWNRGIATEESKLGQVDPLSEIPNCDGCNPKTNAQLTIAARGDLCPFPGSQTFVYNRQNVTFGNLSGTPVEQFLLPYVGGEIDNKIVAWSSFEKFRQNPQENGVKAWIVLGPSSSNGFLPEFSWSTVLPAFNQQFGALRHRGLPEIFNFSYLEIETNLVNQNGTSDGVVPWNPSSNNNNNNNDDGDDSTYKLEIAIGAGLGGSILLILAVVFSYMLFVSKKNASNNNNRYHRSGANSTRGESTLGAGETAGSVTYGSTNENNNTNSGGYRQQEDV